MAAHAKRDGEELETSASEDGASLLWFEPPQPAASAASPSSAAIVVADLFGQVWDENVDPFTNAVHVTISRLRRKLGDPPAIETIPSVGYRITESS